MTDTKARIAAWAREELGLDPAATVTITERQSDDPRCSPVVTEVEIAAPGEGQYKLHIERAMADVERMDVLAAVAFGGHGG